jgi:hypothetical protein
MSLPDVERYSDKYREQKPETSAKWEPGAISILHSICFVKSMCCLETCQVKYFICCLINKDWSRFPEELKEKTRKLRSNASTVLD